MKTLPQPWTAAMEVTAFTGWIYDHLQPHVRRRKRRVLKVEYVKDPGTWTIEPTTSIPRV